MRHSCHSSGQPEFIPAPMAAGNGDETRADGRRRLNRGIGLLLGGIVLGVGGCLFGASMPYHHPVSVVAGVLWWGLYFGCFGMSVGALLGLWAEQRPACPAQRRAGAGRPPAALSDDNGSVHGASRASSGRPGLPAMSRYSRAAGH